MNKKYKRIINIANQKKNVHISQEEALKKRIKKKRKETHKWGTGECNLKSGVPVGICSLSRPYLSAVFIALFIPKRKVCYSSKD